PRRPAAAAYERRPRAGGAVRRGARHRRRARHPARPLLGVLVADAPPARHVAAARQHPDGPTVRPRPHRQPRRVRAPLWLLRGQARPPVEAAAGGPRLMPDNWSFVLAASRLAAPVLGGLRRRPRRRARPRAAPQPPPGPAPGD